MESTNEKEKDMRVFKHDVFNQLSNITLALEQLRYDIPTDNADLTYCVNAIETSCQKIVTLVKEL